MENIIVVSAGFLVGAVLVGSYIKKTYDETGETIILALGVVNLMIVVISGSVAIFATIATLAMEFFLR